MTLEIKERIQKIRSNIVPNGYRKTPIGMMPAAWSIKALSMIVHQVERSVPKPVTPYIRIGIRSHAKGTFHEMVNDPSKIDMDTLFVVKTNDLILNITFAWEHAIALANADDDGKLVSFRFPTYVFDNNNPVYYKYVFSQEIFRQKLDLISPGGAGRNRVLNKKDFLNIQVFVPPLVEQEKIAKVLTAQDNLIALKEKLLSEKQKQKKYLMQTLLCEKLKSGECQKVKISDICEISTGATPDTKNKKFWNGNIRWMNSGELNLKKIYEVEGRITNLAVQKTSTQLLPEKCVLIGLAGQGKTRGTVAMNYVPLCTNQSIAAVHPNDSYCSEFLYYNLEFRYDELRKISSGDGARGGLTLKIIGNVEVVFPSLKEQTKIANILSTADKELSLLRQDIKQEKLKKKALQQLLLTGIVRVKV